MAIETHPVWYTYVGNCKENFSLFGIETSNIFVEATLLPVIHLGYSSSYES